MKWSWLLGFVGVAEAAGLLSAWWSGAADSSWYETLTKPSWQPPSWLFGPVWTILYAMMGVAAYLTWSAPTSRLRTLALGLLGAQLLLNVLWSPLFFRYHVIGWALVEIIALLAVLLATVIVCWRVRPLAGALLVPYIAWVCFATVLNASIWSLN